jgi:hypothetical protein
MSVIQSRCLRRRSNALVFSPLERQTTKQPVSIYKEYTADGNFIWYFCEDGSEVGRKLNPESPTGYDYDIPYNEKNKARILKLAGTMIGVRVKLYHKHSHATHTVSEADF